MPESGRRGQKSAVAGLIVNLIIPGAGTLLLGRTAIGAAQFVIFLASVFMNVTGTMAVAGVPVWIAVWTWALITSIAASRPPD